MNKRLQGNTYLSTDDSTDSGRLLVDDTVDKSQVVSGRTDRANEQMFITAAGFQEVHVLVVDFRARGILDLGTEMISDVV